jgi:hypothetical protein
MPIGKVETRPLAMLSALFRMDERAELSGVSNNKALLPPGRRACMLSSRHRRSSWAGDERHQNAFSSMFRMLAGHWQPVAASLRRPEAPQVRTRHGRKERKSSLPSCWSPWLNVK